MAEKTLNSEKENMKHLGLEFIHHEQTPKEGITQLAKRRIRNMLCLSSTN